VSEATQKPLVAVEDLHRHFRLGGSRSNQVVRAVDGVSLVIERGETFGLVGESGSGKSTLARLLLHLDKPTSGRVRFDGTDLTRVSPGDLRRLRRRMQIVFQDPFASLNRRRTAAETISMPLRVHRRDLKGSERSERVRELLELVGLRPSHADAYPRELSGGQCQRVSIARALALEPEFVVLDEAVSAVDVSIQAQILNLLRELQQRLGLTYLFVSHDLAVVRYMADELAVMYRGRILESGPRDRLFDNPLHPYTHALLASIPSGVTNDARAHAVIHEELTSDLEVEGCRYHPRCPLGARTICRKTDPPLDLVAPGHLAACHYPQTSESLRREAVEEPIASV
jgi:oligopeptide/dipeptide ABC transporter ATP-binding protein